MHIQDLIGEPRTYSRRSNCDLISDVYDLLSCKVDGPYASRFLYHMQDIRGALGHRDIHDQCTFMINYWIDQLNTAGISVHHPRQSAKTISCPSDVIRFVDSYVVNRMVDLDIPRVADRPVINL